MTSIDNSSKGQVFIAGMIMRGKWAEVPSQLENYRKINVTSAQRKDSLYRRDFSPMTLHPYKGFCCFENYWQSGKRYTGLSEEKTLEWWKRQTKGRRRCSLGKNRQVEYAIWESGDKLDYLQSRKQVYVPLYSQMVEDRESLSSLKDMLEKGISLIIYDFDGPFIGNTPVVLPVTLVLLKEKINDLTRPFGHGYLVAGLLAGIDYKDYIDECI